MTTNANPARAGSSNGTKGETSTRTATEPSNRGSNNGSSRAAAATEDAPPEGGEELGGDVATRGDGFSLFGKGPQSHEQVVEGLRGFLTEDPATERKAAKEPKEPKQPKAKAEPQSVDDPDLNAEPGHEPTGDAEEEVDPELEEGKQPEGEADAEGEGEEPAPPKEWPKSAVAEVTKLRADRRDAREALQEREVELTQLRTRLESGELSRPLIVPSDPLAQFDSPDKLAAHAADAREALASIEDALDGVRSDPEQLERWARGIGAWDEANGEVNRGELRRAKRFLENKLSKVIPAKEEFFEKRRQFSALVAQDPPIAEVWRNKNSQEYKDAMGVFGTLPEIRRLPHAMHIAAIYALGLREYRKSAGTRGNGAGAGAAGNGNGNGARLPASRAPAGKRVVTPPGRTAVLPRNSAAAGGPEGDAAIVNKVRTGGRAVTDADMERYTRQALIGKLPQG